MAQHDPSTKPLFYRREMVAVLIRGCVQEDRVAKLDFDTLERVRESGISHDRRSREDDIVWRLRWRERWYLLKNPGQSCRANQGARRRIRRCALVGPLRLTHPTTAGCLAFLRSYERWLYVYLLLEFQSGVERLMAVRLLTCIGLLYQDLTAAGERSPGRRLPPVLPIARYNGEDKYLAKGIRALLSEPFDHAPSGAAAKPVPISAGSRPVG